MKMKRFLALFLALALTFTLTACTPADNPDSPGGTGTEDGELDLSQGVKIGVLFPVTGAAASVGEDARKGIDLAIAHINENGGIENLDGAKLVPVYGDTQSDESAAVIEAERLIVEEEVVAIIGCYQSAITMPVRTVCERYGCPLLMCCSSSDTLVEGEHEWSFLVHETNSVNSRCQLDYIRGIMDEGFEIKTAGLMYENNDNGQGLHEQWTAAFKEMGIDIVVDETFAMDVADVTPIVNKLQSADPDIVMCFANFGAMVLLTDTMMGKGYAPNLLMCASGGEQNSDFIPTVGNNADGFMTGMGWGIDVLNAKPDKLWIAEDYAAANNGETFTGESAAGWADVFLVYEGLNAAGTYSRTALRDALAEIHITEDASWNIYPYEIWFDETGANPNAITPIGQFQDAAVRIIWPESAALEGTAVVLPGSEISAINK
ncbi:ABC transporter substrate-binding protein [Feifania hominis]|uniref:ABC transporter substrate-binding protein n=1 Tax=Feifania hominis TaxID=2763660 RepID=A0A926DCE0_9FIRM|nr:ABC transporter substrate-binding protein [Feifania hominis]MBC8536395.1 ABC transporter substrate-binding protein [Feifania hominis]